ncbi:MAG: hypothetical protein Q9182_003523 [Xanthomendoza sp. 2 TL-2023]
MYPLSIKTLLGTWIVFLSTLLPASAGSSPPNLILPTLPPAFQDTSTPPYRPLTISTPDGPLSGFQNIKIPNFFVANVWNHGSVPQWVRPVDIFNTTLLLGIVSARYAARPMDEIADYGTTGPESWPALRGIDTRVVVKQWTRTNGSLRVPAVPMTNKDIAYAAQMVKWFYRTRSITKEWGWKMLYLTDEDEKTGYMYIANCSGTILVQRDLWYAGYDAD